MAIDPNAQTQQAQRAEAPQQQGAPWHHNWKAYAAGGAAALIVLSADDLGQIFYRAAGVLLGLGVYKFLQENLVTQEQRTLRQLHGNMAASERRVYQHIGSIREEMAGQKQFYEGAWMELSGRMQALEEGQADVEKLVEELAGEKPPEKTP